MKNENIVILSLYKKLSKYSSPIDSIGKELSRDNKIFAIDNPSTFKDYLMGRKDPYFKNHKKAFLYSGKRFFQDQDHPNIIRVIVPLVLPINWLPKGFLYNLARRYNQWLVNKTINSVLRKYKLHDYIFINSYNPLYTFEFKNGKEPKLKLYQTIDNIGESEYVARHGVYMEEKLFATSDFTFVTSTELARYASKFQKEEHVYLIPNAADYDIFSKALSRDIQRPEELVGLESRKIVTYIGNIDQRTNFENLREIVNLENHTLLMIGPVGTDDFSNSGLMDHENVLHIGPRPMNRLPEYLRFTDCAIIPFKCNELTKSIYPLKINEYLAAGRGVVASNFSNDIRGFGHVIRIADDEVDFGAKVKETTDQSENGFIPAELENKYTSVAAENTWRSRADQLSMIIDRYLSS